MWVDMRAGVGIIIFGVFQKNFPVYFYEQRIGSLQNVNSVDKGWNENAFSIVANFRFRKKCFENPFVLTEGKFIIC